MSTVPTPATPPGFRDQSTGLMLFGIFQILIGCICGLMTPLIIVSAMMPVAGAAQGETMNVWMMIPGSVFYLLLAVAFILLGVGSIRARRWAWTLTVILSWLWLIVGVVGFSVFVFLAPKLWALLEQQPKMPPQAIVVMQIFVGVILACIYILLPALFLLFYQRASVRSTCQLRDPQIRWTDRCPMPVLALSLILAYCVLSMPTAMAYGCVLPFFGILISGVPGAVVILLIMLISSYLAWGTYRLKMVAWWGTLLLWLAGILSGLLTFSRMNLMEMYEKMGFPASQLEAIRKIGVSEWTPGVWIGVFLISGAAVLGYLLYVRRYFVRGVTQ